MSTRKQTKKTSKVWNGICVYLWINTFIWGLIIVIVTAWLNDGAFGGLVIGSSMMALSIMRICRRIYLPMYKALPFRKRFTNRIVVVFIFATMVAASVLYYLNVYNTTVRGLTSGFVPIQVGSQNPNFSELMKMIVWVMPIALYAMIVEMLLLTSIRSFVARLIKFFIKYAIPFVIFLGITTSLSYLVSSLGVSLMGTSDGAENIWTALDGYFRYILDADLSAELQNGFLRTSSVFITTLTGAASYRELTEICMDHMYEKQSGNFLSRLVDRFKEPDCLLLLVMTALSAISSVLLYSIAQGVGNVLARFVYYVFAIGWVIAGIMFVVETRIIAYLFSCILMYFVENVFSLSLFANVSSSWLAVGTTWLLRVVCFAYMAALITFMFNFSMEYAKAHSKDDDVEYLAEKFLSGNMFKICFAFAKAYRHDEQ